MTMHAPDGYTLHIADPSMADLLCGMMMRVWRLLEDKDLFSVGGVTPEWVRDKIGPNGFGIVARAPGGEPAGTLIVCFPGMDEDNLGYDIGMRPEELARTALMDTAAVLPEHRGHGLEYRMLRFGEERLKDTEYRWLMCTMSPRNPASLRSAEKAGYTILMTKEKYGGHLRHILCKPINGASLEDLPPIPAQTE